MRVKLNPETTDYIVKCSRYPHGETGYVVGETRLDYMVEWDSGYRYWYKKSDLLVVHQYRTYLFCVLTLVVMMVLSLFVPIEAAELDNDDLAFEFVNSEPFDYTVDDVVREYSCAFTVDEWSYLTTVGFKINVNELDPRDYCQSIKEKINAD